MARRRRRRKLTGPVLALIFLGAGFAAYYSVFFKPIRDAAPQAEAEPAPVAPSDAVFPSTPPPLLAAESPENQTTAPAAGTSRPATTPASTETSSASVLLRAGLDALGRNEPIVARTKLSQALALGLPPSETNEARTHLGRLADQTLFGPAIIPNDPFVIAHVVQPGETLAKIAKANAITSDLLARINGIADKNRIREGQRLKVVRGPFTAVVHSATFDLDVYLDKTMVRHFRVGLGTDGSTPTGTWKVHNRLSNPTYYPPRGGDILSADDPKNPLGERWIGLVGLEGESVGQPGYGIHGTIEPESIGKNMSLGCVRLLNADVELLFEMLVEQRSTVIIR